MSRIIKYNQPIEVTRDQYAKITNRFAGCVAGRYDHDSGKFYIKVWFMSVADKISSYL